MKIDDTLNKTTTLPVSPPPVRTDKAPERVATAPTPSINVQISPLSTQLQAMQSTQASSAVFASKKVEEIKLAISEGRFQVNSEKVADGLLESVKDLLNARKR
ncbi:MULTISPECIES: flagellar biosynthesis anti-sigma factor FlgM [unclassified Undibacterium]|uniref:flagellar biosynthesis anti-sigma factor FlgM n=1 Tax=unclassified Undibacterium TaxID=2630295 RepID=UPI002AC9925E|nr:MULTISPECIES: flagellar biosynthesis anti-sigma factor FlgM [unclassified Undibacterium]MEB0138790.1 flagellar biosynthesis anti-sigma factor FlgM [Undibacterium sp. CCC2.1]MEB0170734.1 flagellar biosynthesis anti-sigma factor FlgM [Undibacterium sp. CCC1.1]MEB0174623.1 flagellar biosynthesis anti-sigma factor FlgM [Undibacterium sp. CCC3.4]MEB0213820.1 flagellar biosynthesis anti-sigma factor FlgM [Undibacterium sp. 5I2]WPX42547.1 flagellar biosynthesis anti-sigma factor FlgM [Undibacteriu